MTNLTGCTGKRGVEGKSRDGNTRDRNKYILSFLICLLTEDSVVAFLLKLRRKCFYR